MGHALSARGKHGDQQSVRPSKRGCRSDPRQPTDRTTIAIKLASKPYRPSSVVVPSGAAAGDEEFHPRPDRSFGASVQLCRPKTQHRRPGSRRTILRQCGTVERRVRVWRRGKDEARFLPGTQRRVRRPRSGRLAVVLQRRRRGRHGHLAYRPAGSDTLLAITSLPSYSAFFLGLGPNVSVPHVA